MISLDTTTGALLGTAVGDALGMPIEGFSHQNVRMYYKGIKEYRADEKRGSLGAGQWTDDTQLTFAVVRAMTAAAREDVPPRLADAYLALRPEARRWGPTTTAALDRLAAGTPPDAAGGAERPTNGAAMRAAPLGLWWAATHASDDAAFAFVTRVLGVTHRHPVALAAGVGQAFAVAHAARTTPAGFAPEPFWEALVELTAWAEGRLGAPPACSARLRRLTDHLDEFPLDLQDLCDGTGADADQSWPFAAAMFARNAGLLEATLLATVNVGGDADTTGAMVGALLGALHGWRAFPEAWRGGLEAADRLEAEAAAFHSAPLLHPDAP